MLKRLADVLVRFRRLVLIATVITIAVAGALGGQVEKHLSSGGFDDPGAEATTVRNIVEDEFGATAPQFLLLATADPSVAPPAGVNAVDTDAVAATGQQIADELSREPGVKQVISYWGLGRVPPLRATNGQSALILAQLTGDQGEITDRSGELVEKFEGTRPGVTIGAGGMGPVFNQVNKQVKKDLTKSELLIFPVTLILLILIFGSVVAASLPLLVGVFAVIGTLAVLRIVAAITEVSIFSLNLTTAMGLGLAIDYSLFVISRYREELGHGFDPHEAVRRTVRTAGKTVAFSALTVAVSLSALLIFPVSFLRSFAYAGVPVVILAGIGAVVALPALLAVLGDKVEKFSWRRNHTQPVAGENGIWHRIALTVMKRPVPIAAAVIGVLVLLGVPFLRLELGVPDDRVLPESAAVRKVQDAIRTDYSSDEASAVSVVPEGIGNPDLKGAEVDALALQLSQIPGVARVDAVTGTFFAGQKVPLPPNLTARFRSPTGTYLSVVPSVDPYSAEGKAIVTTIRDIDGQYPLLVGGSTADLLDSRSALFSRIPIAVGMIALSTFVLLFLMFGSLLVPIKALILNVLSLTATFGAMVWIFQDGHLKDFFGFTPTGDLAITTPIIMFCVAFGLSMDYEVFLLSRIREEYDRTGDNTRSVAMGLERTGRIVTAAALLIAMVFAAMATSKVSFIQLFGVGLAMAVIVDATLIRATLVPAFMRLAGGANWWAPAPMRRFYEKYGISEHDPEIDGVAIAGHAPVPVVVDEPVAPVPAAPANRSASRRQPTPSARVRPLVAEGTRAARPGGPGDRAPGTRRPTARPNQHQ